MKALYAGSFDPFTNGHLDILKEACNIFDEVYVCIANNSEKHRFLPANKMKSAIEKTIEENNFSNAHVIICNQMVADICNELNVEYLIRGLRNTSDYLYEENIAKINKEINPRLKTIYLRAENETVSSSLVREFLKYGKPVEAYLPKPIYSILEIV